MIFMATKLVFKLEKSPKGYNCEFLPDCDVQIVNSKGVVRFDNDLTSIIGTYKNLHRKGDDFFADIELNKEYSNLEVSFDYGVFGHICDKKRNKVSKAALYGISVMPIGGNKW